MSAERAGDDAGSAGADGTARVVLMAAPDAETARQIVRTLVEERIAACGTILPAVTSVYRWRGEVEDAAEALVVFKTTAAGADRLVRRIPELHPYEVPEVLVLPVAAGHRPYLDWVLENVSGGT